MAQTSSANSPRVGKRLLLKRVGLATGAAFVAWVIVTVVIKLYAGALGIEDSEFRNENEIGMWRSDTQLGFSNQPDFDEFCFGNVHALTNDQGFRGRHRIETKSQDAVIRIIGLGDSVMWGTSVNDEDSFLGILRARLSEEVEVYEVVNAGVVGYSMLQEMWYLERDLVAFEPDIVLVNFCSNDALPTEDPFWNVRSIYEAYVTRVLNEPNSGLAKRMIGEAEILRDMFRSDRPVGWAPGTALQSLSIELFLKRPLDRLVELSRTHGFRLIFLLIPPRDVNADYSLYSEVVRRRLAKHGVEYLDLKKPLSGDVPAKAKSDPGWLQTWAGRVLPDMDNVLLIRQLEERHAKQNYIDFIHPSKKGNRIIADRIHEHLIGK
jgi:lysophospholipase L1-like esterase